MKRHMVLLSMVIFAFVGCDKGVRATEACVPGEWKTGNGVVSECVDGLWKVRRITRQWGTAKGERGYSVAVDAFGAIYVTGETSGELDGNTRVGGSDIFLSIIPQN